MCSTRSASTRRKRPVVSDMYRSQRFSRRTSGPFSSAGGPDARRSPEAPMTPAMRLAGWLALTLVWLVANEPLQAQDRPKRFNVWDIHIGAAAREIPDEFVNYACGTNGGPPSVPLSSFAEFAKCRADANGLREV